MSDLNDATAILSMATAVEDAPVSASESTEVIPPENTDSPDPETPESAVDSPSEDGEPSSTPAQPTTAQIRASLKAFRESNPEHAQAAKLLNDGYSRFEAYKEVIPTVEEARNIRAQLDTIGGLEGLANMQETLASIEETDALLDAGDPAVLDQIIEDSPDGFKKLAPHYLQRLSKLDPEAFGRTLHPYFVNTLIDANFPNVLNALASLVQDKPEAATVVKNIREWFDGQKNLSDRLRTDTISPEREALNAERAELEKGRRADMENKIGSEVGAHIRSELGSRLKPYAASLNALAPAVRNAVAREAISELARALEADAVGKKQTEAMMAVRKPDVARIVSYNKSRVSSLADSVIAKIVKEFQLKPGAAPARPRTAPKPGAKAAPSGEVVKISKAPNNDDIDWEYPGAQQGYIRHRAMMKSGVHKGKFVQW